MSEHITHTAVYEDCARILKYSGNKITKAFHEALENAYDSGLLCCGARGNHLYAIPILEKNSSTQISLKTIKTKQYENLTSSVF